MEQKTTTVETKMLIQESTRKHLRIMSAENGASMSGIVESLIEEACQEKTKKTMRTKGFTLIELLVVVIIIGILTSIATPVFLNQRKAAWRASVQADVHNAHLTTESSLVDADGGMSQLTFTGGVDGNALTITPKANAKSWTSPVSTGNTLTGYVSKDSENEPCYVITGQNKNVPGWSYTVKSTTTCTENPANNTNNNTGNTGNTTPASQTCGEKADAMNAELNTTKTNYKASGETLGEAEVIQQYTSESGKKDAWSDWNHSTAITQGKTTIITGALRAGTSDDINGPTISVNPYNSKGWAYNNITSLTVNGQKLTANKNDGEHTFTGGYANVKYNLTLYCNNPTSTTELPRIGQTNSYPYSIIIYLDSYSSGPITLEWSDGTKIIFEEAN
jgi:type IV pilus assembly protein PilA